jgi:vacuolar protein sorting-associated protein 54
VLTNQLISLIAKQMKSMTFDSFFDLLISVFTTLMHILQRTSTLHEVIKNVITDAQNHGIVIGQNSIIRNKDSSESEPMTVRTLGEDDDDDLGSMEFGGPVDEPISTTKKRPDPASVLHELTMDYDESIKEAISPTKGPQAFSQMISESSEVVLAVSDLSNARTSKLIGVRSEQNAQLNPKDFYRLFGATREFIVGSEGLSGHHCIGLKGTMQSQVGLLYTQSVCDRLIDKKTNKAKAYLSHFHDERSKQIAVLVENEQWVKAEVPVDFQRLTEQIMESSKLTSPTSVHSNDYEDDDELGRDSIGGGDDDDGDLSAMLGQGNSKSDENMSSKRKVQGSSSSLQKVGSKSSRYLVVDGQKFYVAGCVLLFTKMLVEYMQCIENIPTLATDVLNRVLEILKVF